MRWSCPHCGINLAISDDKLGSGWSFSRCYKCGGFALIRRAEVNLIKVDRAPAGEHVILPEASETPMMSNEATQNLDKYFNTAKASAKPVIKPAIRRNAESEIANMDAMASFPQPLPEAPIAAEGAYTPQYATTIRRFLPAGIGIAGILAIGSGIYLYMQGQKLWEKARVSAANDAREVAAIKPVSAVSNPYKAPAAPVAPPVVADQVHHSAMAPERPAGADQITPFAVKIRSNNASLHAGPGMQYPVVGIANQQLQYVVIDWNDRWFRVTAQTGVALSAMTSATPATWIRNDLVQLVNNNRKQ